MAIAELNVRLGIIHKDFDKTLRGVEKSMNAAAERLSGLGNSMSLGLTLPLLAFGKQAITASAEMDSLRLAMESTMQGGGRSIGEAHRELEMLRKAALAPGLDLKQAVEGSLRLQNVGLSAEKSRGILVQLANAIATTGGAAPQLDGVTKQFGQMLAKGRILQEDLSIIQENMPAVSQAMEKAFGTKSAEKLRDMGISAEQFIDGVNGQLALLPRVAGGLQNSLTNAASGIKQFFAGVGDEISKAFNVAGKSDALTGALSDATLWFRTLSDEQKKTILNFALIAAATGPAVKGISLLYGTVGSAVSALRAVSAGAASAGGTILGLADRFTKLSTVMKFTVAGAAIAGVLALATAYSMLKDNIANANPIYNKLKEIEKEATAAVAEERAAIAPLISTLNSETASRDQKAKAIKRLQEISPKYFANLDEESAKTGALKIAVDLYVESLFRAARAKAAESKIGDLAAKEDELLRQKAATMERIEKMRKFQQTQSVEGATKIEEAIQKQLSLFKKQEDEYRRQKEAIQGVIEANTDLNETIASGGSTEPSGGSTGAKASKEPDKQLKALADLREEMAVATEQGKVFGDTYERMAEVLTKGIEKMTEVGFLASDKNITDLVKRIEELKGSLGPMPVTVTAEKAREDLKAFAGDSAQVLGDLAAGLRAGFGVGNEAAMGLAKTAEDLKKELEAGFDPKMDAAGALAALDAIRLKVADVSERASTALGAGFGGGNEAAAELSATVDALKKELEAGLRPGFDPAASLAALDSIRAKVVDVSEKMAAALGAGFGGGDEAAAELSATVDALKKELETGLGPGLDPAEALAALDSIRAKVADVSEKTAAALGAGFGGGNEAAAQLSATVDALKKELEAGLRPGLDPAGALAALDLIRAKVVDVSEKTATALGVGLGSAAEEAKRLGNLLGGIRMQVDTEEAKNALADISALAENIRADTGLFFSPKLKKEEANAALEGLRAQVDALATGIGTALSEGFLVGNEAAQALADRAQALRDAFALVPVGLDATGAVEALNRLSGEAHELSGDISGALSAGFAGGAPALDALIGKALQLKKTVAESFAAAGGQLPSIPRNTGLAPLPTTGDLPGPSAASLKPMTAELASFSDLSQSVVDKMSSLQGAATPIMAEISQAAKDMASSMGLGVNAAVALNDGLSIMADTAGPAFQGLAESLLGVQGAYRSTGAAALAAAMQIVKSALAATLAKGIQQSFASSKNPFVGILVSGIVMGAINALFNKIGQSLAKTPKFAAGTIGAPGGMAIVGEFGPELVNLPKGSQVTNAVESKSALRDMMVGQAIEVRVVGLTKISSDALYIMYQKESQRRVRRG